MKHSAVSCSVLTRGLHSNSNGTTHFLNDVFYNNLFKPATNSARKLNICWPDGYTFRMHCTQVCVFKQSHQEGFRCFL